MLTSAITSVNYRSLDMACNLQITDPKLMWRCGRQALEKPGSDVAGTCWTEPWSG
jgi:hypothetical protein